MARLGYINESSVTVSIIHILAPGHTINMSPISLAGDDLPQQPHSADSVLVLGSMDRMAEYQHLVQLLRNRDPQAQVQGEMVDRILQNGKWLRSS